MDSAQRSVKRINIPWGIVGVLLIGVYFSLGWFTHSHLTTYKTEQEALHKAEIGIGGGPHQRIEEDSVDMLCIPLEREEEEVREI